jgi:hypothetical protein
MNDDKTSASSRWMDGKGIEEKKEEGRSVSMV